jgi:hypothetical protein
MPQVPACRAFVQPPQRATACDGRATVVRCTGTAQEALDRATAVAACAAWGGTLASVRDATEENCLESIVPIQGNAWIGLVQAAGAAMPADDWTWLDGLPLGYTHWFSGEPNDADGIENDSEQCGMIYSPSIGSGWNDAECSKSLQIACSR